VAWYTRYEREAAKRAGARRHVGSGSFWWAKSDAESDECLFEVKVRRALQARFPPRVWNQLYDRALSLGKRPVLVVILRPAPGVEQWRFVKFPKRLEKGFVVRWLGERP
jgi:hypothetical protein